MLLVFNSEEEFIQDRYGSLIEEGKLEEAKSLNAIGPHEGIEFLLFEAGCKDVILLADDLPLDEAFANAERLAAEYITASYAPLVTSYIFYRPSHKKHALRLKELQMETLQYKGFTRERKIEHERETGQILGYEDWQIEAYIEKLFGKE